MDFSSLNQYAAVLGSGAILVLNEHQSIIDLLWSILRFFRHESCGNVRLVEMEQSSCIS
jgi:NADH:ubiquinone oxidoreductase subunit F (NADH-binding)